jgi:hypothetical protein
MIFRSWRLFLGHDGRRRHHAHRHDPELAFRLNVHRCHQAAITAPPRPKLSTGYPQTLHPLDNRIELGFPGVGRGPGGSAAARHAAGVLPSLHVALGPARRIDASGLLFRWFARPHRHGVCGDCAGLGYGSRRVPVVHRPLILAGSGLSESLGGPARAAASGLSLGRVRHEACLASMGKDATRRRSSRHGWLPGRARASVWMLLPGPGAAADRRVGPFRGVRDLLGWGDLRPAGLNERKARTAARQPREWSTALRSQAKVSWGGVSFGPGG